MCFRILFDRTVYSSDGSAPPFSSQFTNGIKTDATFADGFDFLWMIVLFVMRFISSMHLMRFALLEKKSVVNKLVESQNVRFTFNRTVVRDNNIFYLLRLSTKSMNSVVPDPRSISFRIYYWYKYQSSRMQCKSMAY